MELRGKGTTPGSGHFGLFIVWACLVTIGVVLIEDALRARLETFWQVVRYVWPFLLLGSLGFYLWRRQKEILDELYALSVRDTLTGAFNRLYLYESLRAIVREGKGNLSVVFLDVNGLKGYNDRNGHWAGDAVLKALVESWRQVLGKGEFIARYGGDEFVVVLRRTEEEAAGPVAAAAGEFKKRTTLGVSAGVAPLRADDTEESLMQRADQEMYERKRMMSDVARFRA